MNGNSVVESEFQQADESNGDFMDILNKNEHNKLPLLRMATLWTILSFLQKG